MGPRISTPLKRVGSPVARANNTIYQAPSDGFVHTHSTGGGTILCLTEPATPPTLIVQRQYTAVSQDGAAYMIVKKGDYWKVNNVSVFVEFVPLEP